MKQVALLLGLCLTISAFAAHADGELLVGNKSDASVWRLSLADGRKLGEIPSGDGPHEIAVSADGRRALVTDYGDKGVGHSLTALDLVTKSSAGSVDLGEHERPHGIRYLPDGNVLVTTERSEALLRVDPVAGRVLQAIDVGEGTGHMVAVSADGSAAFVSKIAAGTVVRVDVAAGVKTHEVESGKGAEGIDVAPDGTVWVTNRADNTVTVHDPDTLEKIATLPSEGFPIRVVFTPDQRHALVTNATAGTLSVFDAAARTLLTTVNLVEEGAQSFRETMLGEGALPIGAIADPAKPRVYVAISGANQIAVIDSSTWQVIDRWQTGNQPDALGLVPELESAMPAEQAADAG